MYQWIDDIAYNVRRLSKHLIRGRMEKIISPEGVDGPNNLQRLMKFTAKHTNNILKKTLNATANDIANAAKNLPEDFLKNAICLAPNLVRIAQAKKHRENRFKIRKRISSHLRFPGKLL